MILIPQSISASITDNFDSYNDGGLDGQGGWTKNANDATVGAAYKYGASGKGVEGEQRVGEDVITKSFPSGEATGNQIAYVQIKQATGTAELWMMEGSNFRILFGIVSDDIAYHDGTGWVVLQAGISQDTWYKIECEWIAATDLARYRIDDGTWSDWDDTYAAITTEINGVRLYPDAGSVGDKSWYDELSDPNAVSPVAEDEFPVMQMK